MNESDFHVYMVTDHSKEYLRFNTTYSGRKDLTTINTNLFIQHFNLSLC